VAVRYVPRKRIHESLPGRYQKEYSTFGLLSCVCLLVFYYYLGEAKSLFLWPSISFGRRMMEVSLVVRFSVPVHVVVVGVDWNLLTMFD
jgi:hypothetical protein